MRSIAISIVVSTLLIAGVATYWVYTNNVNQQQLTKQQAVQGCITILPEVNPGWYNKCMAEKGYQANLTY